MNLNDYLSDDQLDTLIKAALAEDLGESGDITSLTVIPEDAQLKARVTARQDVVLAGLPVAQAVFNRMPGALTVVALKQDGDLAGAGEAVMEVEGAARDMLTAERTALNFMQRLTGIATATHAYVEKVKGFKAEILDTRKTMPTMRGLDKYAVRCGGGTNHRMGLYDRIMMKDNHLACRYVDGPIPFPEIMKECREKHPDVMVEVEVDTIEQFKEVVEALPDWILLDNMSNEQMTRCVEMNQGRCRLEASGNVNLTTVEGIAATGVDAISVGAITHSVIAADLGLDVLL